MGGVGRKRRRWRSQGTDLRIAIADPFPGVIPRLWTYFTVSSIWGRWVTSCVAKHVTKPIRNREARVTEPQLE
jgi:hypothetical protein